MEKVNWKLCLVADTGFAPGRNIISLVQEASESGVTLVQLRAKNLTTLAILRLAMKLSDPLKKKNIPLIINDRADIAFSCGAAGVHLGQEDLPLRFARKILGSRKLIGMTVNTPQEARQAQSRGANYIGAGPVFQTRTKQNLRPPIGLEGLQAITREVEIPVLAIGGINVHNAGEVMECGVDGIAVISAVLGADHIHRATAELRKAIKR
ncbi:MAG: thiamine phosphate synthase [Candidatus Aminicenantes bacterium]